MMKTMISGFILPGLVVLCSVCGCRSLLYEVPGGNLVDGLPPVAISPASILATGGNLVDGLPPVASIEAGEIASPDPRKLYIKM